MIIIWYVYAHSCYKPESNNPVKVVIGQGLTSNDITLIMHHAADFKFGILKMNITNTIFLA